MLVLAIICVGVLILYSWEAHRSYKRLKLYQEASADLMETKEKLERMTRRPRSSNGKFLKK